MGLQPRPKGNFPLRRSIPSSRGRAILLSRACGCGIEITAFGFIASWNDRINDIYPEHQTKLRTALSRPIPFSKYDDLNGYHVIAQVRNTKTWNMDPNRCQIVDLHLPCVSSIMMRREPIDRNILMLVK